MIDFNPQDYQPGFSVDNVIFGFHDRELKVLLMKLKQMEQWSLPGGFVQREEDVDQAAQRVVQERTGLGELFLQQFFLFGQVDRNDQGHAAHLQRIGLLEGELFAWFNQRFISMGYYALVEYSQVQQPAPDFISERCEWCNLEELPPMMLDHARIVQTAHQALRRDLRHKPIGLNLLPKRFTMPELQALYETILGLPLDRRNFQRKMLSYGILHRTEERRKGGAHKAPWLYEFDEEAYAQALAEGLQTGW